MFCIAAFIVIGIISIFSAKYRTMAKKAWGCMARRMTLRPCDTNFKEETKAALLARVAHKGPRVIKAADIGLEIAAFAVLFLTIWSLFVAVKSGVNLYVYGTCNPSNASSCSLGAEACSVESGQPGFWQATTSGDLLPWLGHEFSQFGESISLIPSRWKTWQAEEYLPVNASYATPFDASKPVAVEVIDPGCQFCAQLYYNMKSVDFLNRYNVSYIAFPIPDSSTDTGYKFPHSLHIVRYLEAIRKVGEPAANKETIMPADWRILERIFTGADKNGTPYQQSINVLLNEEEVEALMRSWLIEFGYSDQELATLADVAASEEISTIIQANNSLLTDTINTLKIPTIIFDGKRHDGVVTEDGFR